jgi:phosphoglycerate dehydrogenase-like enzyme
MTVTGAAARDGLSSVAGEVVYLSTLALPDSMLARFRAVSPRLRIVQQPCTAAGQVPDELWRQVQILHTNTTLPDPRQAPRLSWVQLDTAGIDHLAGHPIWTETAIPVTTIGGVSGRWTAEYVLMMLLAASHRLPRMLDLQRARTWPSLEDRWATFLPGQLAGTTCTIIGFGRLGQAIGELCLALGMHVIGIRRNAGAAGSGGAVGTGGAAGPAGPGAGQLTVAGPEALPGALGRSASVVVAVPLTPATRMLLSRALIEAIQPGAFLVNVSRGGVVDEDALADALRSGRLGGAAMDVFAAEPLPADSPLWDVPGLVISPHVSGFAGDYLPQVSALVAENLRRYIAGEPLLNIASREAGY